MKHVYIYCEGQTEEAFINTLLYPYFLEFGIFVFPIICTTKRTAAKKFKGGVSDYGKLRKELQKLCKSHPNACVTTMFDYYAMPENTPGIRLQGSDLYERIRSIEAGLNADIGAPNCRFHFMLHEFEGLLFSKPEAFRLIADEDTVQAISAIRAAYPTPEHINNAPDTAPSKRITALLPHYAKIINGTQLAEDIGMDTLLAECPHFRAWIEALKKEY